MNNLANADKAECRKLLRHHQKWRAELRRGGNYCESTAETKNIDAIKARMVELDNPA